MNKKHIVYIGFGTICGFRHPLGILEHIPCGKEGTIVMLGVGQKMTTGSRQKRQLTQGIWL